MLFWACANTLILTAIGYWFVSERAEQRALSYLSGYIEQRVRAESQVFRAGEANLMKFKERFLALYQDANVLKDPQFETYFKKDPDGALRMPATFFTGTIDANGLSRSGTTGFIGRKHAPLTPELKRRLVLAYQLISELGPAWNGQLVNLHATFPENAAVFHWPNVPWGLEARAEEYFPDMNIVGSTLQKNNPKREPVWSTLYFDRMARKWNVTYQVPVDLHGKHLINPSHDILLDELMQRLIDEHPPGAYNLILAKNGSLIAHPDRLDHLRETGTDLNVRTLGDPALLSIYKLISKDAARSAGSQVRIVEDAKLDAYVSFAEIGGPGWWFVTVYPRSLVLESARETANWLLGIGILSFMLMTLVVVGVLRQRVSRPIGQMKVASERLSSGDYLSVANGEVRLPEEQNNEIGLLAQSFKSMARKVGDSARYLEQVVEERTMELAVANSALERLTLQDSLTGAFNRRAFDRDLATFASTAAGSEEIRALMLCDIDHFKQYNDRYGHQMGDACLQLVISEIARQARGDCVYRYGGEEIGVLLKGASADAIRQCGERIIRGVEGLGLPHGRSSYGVVTISGGLTLIGPGSSSVVEVIAATDALLYEAKQAGRNRLSHRLPPTASPQ
jgi:diguanylate cyclase (GGDEF)-like protein